MSEVNPSSALVVGHHGEELRFTGLWELLDWRARQTPDALAMVDEHGRRLSFSELRDEAEAVAAALHDRGVVPGGRVSWQLPTWIETFVLMAAVVRLDAAQNPILPISREREMGFIIDQWAPDLLVVPESYRGFDHAALAETARSRRPDVDVLVLRDRLPRADPRTLPPYARTAGDEPVRWILYSSGTTAEPKGARHTDASVFRAAANLTGRIYITAEDRTAVVAPVAHVGGIMWFIASLISGCASVVCDRFDAATLDVLRREGVTLAGMGTSFHEAYLARQLESAEPVLPQVRAFPGGGSTRAPDLHARLKKAFGVGVVSGYGSTETGPLTIPDLGDSDAVLGGTEGRPYPGTILKIVDEAGQEVRQGEVGEIRAKGPQMMVGYVDPALDLDVFDEDGFFRTGDLGSQDEDGNLVIRGRLKDIIIRKGENISAAEVESALLTHPDIAAAAVIALPDPDTGERCCAVVVLEPGRPAPSLVEVKDHLLREGLAIQKVPEQLEVIDELPRAGVGKVAKNVLRTRYGVPTPSPWPTTSA